MKHQTSIYAISQFMYSETLIRKIVWLLFLVLVVTGCSYKISKFLQIYLTYPVIISLEEEQKPDLDFPAVTICNINRMKNDFIRCLNNDIMENGCQISRKRKRGKNIITGMILSERRYLLSCWDWHNGTLNKKNITLVDFIKKYMAMSPKNHYFVGQKMEELVQYCSFESKVCSSENITFFHSLKYGNCYTFNKFKRNGEQYLKTSSMGYNSGLELTLNVDHSEYIQFTPSIGAHVLIHDPKEIPAPDDKGVNISPGFEISITLKQVIMNRLPAPYRDQCRNYRVVGMHKNEDECMKDCLQKRNYEVCGCVDPTVTSRSNQAHCDINSEEDVCCLDKVQDQIISEISTCDCPLACFSKYYEHQLSKAIWPSKEFIGIKQKESPGKIKQKKTTKRDWRFYRENTIRLKIYYSSLMSKEYRQMPMFDTSEIFRRSTCFMGWFFYICLVRADGSINIGVSQFSVQPIRNALIW